MKKSFALAPLFLAALALAGCEPKPAPNAEPTTTEKAELALKNAVAKTKELALEAKDVVADQLAAWHLTPAEIKEELERTGRIVRAKAATAVAKSGQFADQARIVAVVTTKLVADREFSARQIGVTSADGIVTLTGTVPSAALIGRAVTLALDTDGVTQVVSLLTGAM